MNKMSYAFEMCMEIINIPTDSVWNSVSYDNNYIGA